MAQKALELTLISATDLKDVRHISTMKVYAVVWLNGDPSSGQLVAVDRTGGCNPSWNATLHFTIPSNQAGSLNVVLRTERTFGDRNVGVVLIPLSNLSGAPDGPGPVQRVSYQVHSIESGMPPQGVLNFSYKLGEVTQQQAGQQAGRPQQQLAVNPQNGMGNVHGVVRVATEGMAIVSTVSTIMDILNFVANFF